MNKKCFCVGFSKVLRDVIISSELARTTEKVIPETSKSAVDFSRIFAVLKPLAFSLLGFVAFSSSASTETLIIKADPHAPKNQQPIVLKTANGLPQVNIQTPNEKGLSHNKYQNFDVGSKGAVLNNSRKAAKTRQAGMIQGNPYLARGEAKVILNEVTSNNPSIMKGYVEVAGKKAEVIIANPNGLHCDGCGVINATRATLTSGKPQLKDGMVDSYRVTEGKLKVSGKGMDNSGADYTDIIARETEINAGIWANKKLNVVTGKNSVKTGENPDADIQITRLESKDQAENAPHFAVDISELGGMYAGKIHLVGTEQGVGVRNAGHIGTGSESLTIDSAGRIVNRGSLSSQQQITVKSEREIENTGLIEAKTQQVNLQSGATVKQDGSVIARRGDVNIKAKTAITQRGETIAGKNVAYQAARIRTEQSALIIAGVSAENMQDHQTDKQNPAAINIRAHNQAHLNGRHITDGQLSVSAQHVDMDNSRNIARNTTVEIQLGDVPQHNSSISAVENLTVSTTKDVKSAHSTVISAERNIKTGSEQSATDGLLLKAMSGLLLDAGTTLQQRYVMAARKVKSNIQPAYSAGRNEITRPEKTLVNTAHTDVHMENAAKEPLNERLGTFLAQNSTEIRVLANTLKPYNPKQAVVADNSLTALNVQKTQEREVRLKTNPNRAVREKDLQFIDMKRWLSSDYMLNALRHEHEIVHKRSAQSRFFQQCWANDQINQLTENNFSEKDIILKQ